jgi:hypothetical protein
VSLQGLWQLNPAASDDAEQIIGNVIAEEEKERRRFRKQMERDDPRAMPDVMPEHLYRERRGKHETELRNELGVTKVLKVTQNGPNLTLSTDSDTRRFEAGTRSQTSMPTGDLADARVGWDGEWFVIDRKVPGRMHQTERLRILKKTGQLEYITKWSGDTDLSGVKFHRIFDPLAADPNTPDPKIGPVR